MPPFIKAISAQAAGLIFVYALSRNGILPNLSLIWLAFVQGIFAAIVSALLVTPRWWRGIHLCFLPIVIIAIQWQLPSFIYGGAFCFLLLIYWTSFRTQVPLFLSNHVTVHRLAAWLPAVTSFQVLDLGSGIGSFCLRLAQLRPEWIVMGIESAPAPFAISRWLGRHEKNLNFSRADFWQLSLANYDLVYAFLSPVPMPQLWKKARKEMRPGSILVSNSFAIPNIKPNEILQIDDRRQTQLFIYRIPERKPQHQ